MKDSDILQKEITELTSHIETNYPELYQFLEENPITIPASDQPEVGSKALEDYLESLKQMLKHHLEVHGHKIEHND